MSTMNSNNFEHRFYQSVPDSFWDELEDMITELDLAFDDELIDLKKNEEPVPVPNNTSTSTFEAARIVERRESRLSSISDTVTTAPVGSLGQAILENIKKTNNSLPINPIRYQAEAGISNAEISRVSGGNGSEIEAPPGLSGGSKKKRKKDKHKKKHKKEKKKKHRKNRSRDQSSSSVSSRESHDQYKQSKSKDHPPSIPKTYQDEFLDRYYAVEPVKKLQHTTLINAAGIPSDEEDWDQRGASARPGPLSKKPAGYKDKQRSPPKPAVIPNIEPISENEDNWDDLVGMAGKIKAPGYSLPAPPGCDDYALRQRSPSPSYRRRRSKSRSPIDRRRRRRWDSRSPRRRGRSRSRSLSPLSAMIQPSRSRSISKKRSPSPVLPRLRTPSPYSRRRNRSPYQRPGPLQSKRFNTVPRQASDEENWDTLVGTAGKNSEPVSSPPKPQTSTTIQHQRSRSRSIASDASFHTIDEDVNSPANSKTSKSVSTNPKNDNDSDSDASTVSPDRNPIVPYEEIDDSSSSDDSDVVATGTLGTINTQSARFDQNIIREKQDEDAIVRSVKQVLRDEQQPEEYYLKVFMSEYKELGLFLDDLLYREFDGKRVTWVPESIINDVIRSVHVLEYNIHLSYGRTMRALERHYFWPFMLDTVRDFLKHCPVCGRKTKGESSDGEDGSSRDPTSAATPDDDSKEPPSSRESPKLFMEPPMVVDECANDALDDMSTPAAVATFSNEIELNSSPFFEEKSIEQVATNENTSTSAPSTTGDTKTHSPVENQCITEEQIVVDQSAESFCFTDSMCNKMEQILQVTEICQEVSDPPSIKNVEYKEESTSSENDSKTHEPPATLVENHKLLNDTTPMETDQVQKDDDQVVQEDEPIEDGEIVETETDETEMPQESETIITVPKLPVTHEELSSEVNELPTNVVESKPIDSLKENSKDGTVGATIPSPSSKATSPINVENNEFTETIEAIEPESMANKNESSNNIEELVLLNQTEKLDKESSPLKESTVTDIDENEKKAAAKEKDERKDDNVTPNKSDEQVQEPIVNKPIEQDESLLQIESLVDGLIDGTAEVENIDTS